MFDVRGSGHSYAVFDGDKRVTDWYYSKEPALSAIDKLLHEARQSPRICMTCRTPFMSDGPHNRMCGKCRNTASEGIR